MTLGEPERNELTAVVERARNRVFINQALCELGVAATVTLVGPTLLLLLGRQWFAWPMLAVFAVGGIGIAGWRLWQRRPDLYRVSQALDARMASEDQISTAVYFLPSQERVAVEQRRAAARLAGRSDVEAAFPFGLPRSLYALASVFLVASALCALRYFLEKPMRVEQPLPQLILQALGGGPWTQQARRQEAQPRQPDAKQARAFALENQNPGSHSNAEPGREVSDPSTNGSPDPNGKGQTPNEDQNGKGQNAGPQTGDEFGDPIASDAENDAIQSYEEMLERDAKSGLSKAEGNQGKDSNGNDNRPGSSEAANSLLAKLREAMNNMLSRLQQKAPGAGQQQQGAGSPSNNGDEQKEGSGEGRSGAGQPKAGGQEADGEGSESESQQMSAENSAGKGGKTSDQGSRGSSGDGAGKQEGDKRIQEALQQEAMGKLSELYGRRAANVTGEVSVETQAGKQTLRTPQGQSQARHSDSGGEVSRDEIPLAYQAYIKEYFNKLRQPTKK